MAHPHGHHYRFDPDVQRAVDRVKAERFHVHAVTYINHPWVGWDGRSVDFWNAGELFRPLWEQQGWRLVRFLLADPYPPAIRHLIYRHSLWTAVAGWSYWGPHDHIAEQQHVHVTFQRPS